MTTFKVRSVFLCFCIACVFCVIIGRLFVIQVVNGEYYAQQSKKQTQQRAMITAKRGNIFDRKGQVLATSVESRVKLALLAPEGDSTDIRPGAQKNGAINVKRLYPNGACAGPVLGYIGKDGCGLGGAEFYFDKFLKGEDGWAILARDGKNNKYAKVSMPSKQPRGGHDVYLTLDVDIQKIVENVLKQAVSNLKACGAMCVVTEPATGKILAMAGEPSFNPNIPSGYPLSQRLNKCINSSYEPGSTFKVLTAACALQEKVKRETDTIDGNHGSFDIFNEKIRDKRDFGRISFLEAFKYSSNVCFAKVANCIGNQRLYDYTRNFGLGTQTGIQLPGEETGIVHPIEKWSGRTRVTMAIGQEISTTVLQMAMLFSTVANGGVLLEPRMYERIVDENGGIVDSACYKPVRQVISKEVAARLTAMMCEVVSGGTGTKAAVKGISVAGKTGTAQKIDKTTGAYSDKKAWASFIGFLPAENPLLLCAVVIDEPANAEMGGAAAAPVFQKIMTQIISHPQLEYAEKILHGAQPQLPETQQAGNVPDLCGMQAAVAMNLLEAERIPYECVGDRNGKIAYQTPRAGLQLEPDAKVVFFTAAPRDSKASGGASMPNCIGRDLRDAINIMNLKGLSPVIRGAGIVRDQSPRCGAPLTVAAPCTLSCSFDIGKRPYAVE
jgi:cell division protein FtsI (penicillin-binding protein 3)